MWALPAQVRILPFTLFLLLIFFFPVVSLVGYFLLLKNLLSTIHEIVVHNNTFIQMPTYAFNYRRLMSWTEKLVFILLTIEIRKHYA